MIEWPSFTVAELQEEGVLLVEDGNHGEYRPRPNEFEAGGTAFIRAGDLSDGQVQFASAAAINEIALRRIHKGIGKPGDILFSHKGTVGKLARVPNDAPAFVCSPQTTFWRIRDDSRLRSDYLYAFMRSRRFIDQWWARKGETDMADYVSLTAQRQLRVVLPPIEVQRSIGNLIEAFDDLVEGNWRRVGLLEEMARLIYREWFVHFRFPGHEDVALVDSDVGPAPQGWNLVPVGQLAEVTMGQSPKSEHYNNEGVGKPFHQGVTDFGVHFPTTRKWCSVPGRGARDGDVLVSVRAPVGRINVADVDLTIGRGLAAMRAKDGRQALLLAHMRHAFAEEDSMGGGTIFKAIGKQELAGVLTLQVPDSIATEAEAIFAGNLALIRVLTTTGRRLAAMRDQLLPKLVAGQIDASSLDLEALLEGTVA